MNRTRLGEKKERATINTKGLRSACTRHYNKIQNKCTQGKPKTNNNHNAECALQKKKKTKQLI